MSLEKYPYCKGIFTAALFWGERNFLFWGFLPVYFKGIKRGEKLSAK
jgi:hypothetical protein